MTAAELLHQLNRLGVHLSTNGDRLVCEAPKGVLTPELQAQLRFHKTDILSLLAQAEGAAQPSRPRLQPRPQTGDVALSPGQARSWQMEQLEPGRAVYHIPAAFRLYGTLYPDILAQSIAEIVRRHEILRTTFVRTHQGPVQRIAPEGEVKLHRMVLPKAVSETTLMQQLQQEAMRPFEVSSGPLFRVSLGELGPGDYILLITMHHMVSDGWSFPLFFRELETLYTAYLQQRSPPLEPLRYSMATMPTGNNNGFRAGRCINSSPTGINISRGTSPPLHSL